MGDSGYFRGFRANAYILVPQDAGVYCIISNHGDTESIRKPRQSGGFWCRRNIALLRSLDKIIVPVMNTTALLMTEIHLFVTGFKPICIKTGFSRTGCQSGWFNSAFKNTAQGTANPSLAM